MGEPLQPLIHALQNAKRVPPDLAKVVAYGQVASSTSDGCTILFDGELTPSIKRYRWVNDRPAVGDRVMLVRTGGSWIVTGVVNAGPRELPVGTDLNNFTTPGTYVRSMTADASTALNYPRAVAGLLEVFKNVQGNHIWQRYTPYGGYSKDSYIRADYSGSWSPWMIVRGNPSGTSYDSGILAINTAEVTSVSLNQGVIRSGIATVTFTLVMKNAQDDGNVTNIVLGTMSDHRYDAHAGTYGPMQTAAAGPVTQGYVDGNGRFILTATAGAISAGQGMSFAGTYVCNDDGLT